MENIVLSTIKNRRSVRKYRPEQISGADLEAILEAGRYAPSGGNNQTTHFYVIQREAALGDLIRLAEQEFSKMEAGPDLYKSLRNSIAASKKGGYVFTLHAPTLIVVTNKKGYGNAMADCSCALQNMMIAAAAIGVGACWINQLRWLSENETIVGYLNSLGFAEDEIVCGSLALGYPAEEIPPPLPRTGNPVSYIR